jgi:transposase
MTVYIGVDFHARQQTLCYLTTEDGQIKRCRVEHVLDDVEHQNVRAFYSQFKGKVIVGIESGGCSDWFERMMGELGIEVWVGNAFQIRRLALRKQKNDKRDAEHILGLLVSGRFPRLYRRTEYSSEVLSQIGYRHKVIKMRTMLHNTLRAIARNQGLMIVSKMTSNKGRARLERLNVTESVRREIDGVVELIERLEKEVKRVEQWLGEQATKDRRTLLLQTHPGIGLLTSLALVHTLEPVERFANSRKVTAFVGLDPVEDSSAERIRIGPISKAGSKLMRFLLVEAGQIAIRKDEELKRFYNRVALRRNKPKAKVAVARKLLVRSFIMLRDNIDAGEFQRRGVEARSSRVARTA